MTMGTDDWRLRRDDVVSLRLKFKKRRFQMIDDIQIQQDLQRLGEAEVFGGRLRDRLIQLAAHRRQAELIQFQMKGGHEVPFEAAE